jgi:hypothetical protein
MQCPIDIALYRVDIQVDRRQVSDKREVVERLDTSFDERGKMYGAFVRFKMITMN